MTTATITTRHFAGEADLAPIAELINLCDAVDRLDDSVSVEELRRDLEEPHIQPARDVRLWLDSEGRLVGLGWAWTHPSDGDQEVDGFLYWRVQPDARGGDVEDAIFDWGVGRFQEMGRERGLPARIGAGTIDHDAYGRAVIERRGFVPARHFMRMDRPLDAPISEPALPEGYALCHVAGEDDVERWVEMYNLSFVDHWNFHAMTPDVRRRTLAHPHHRPERDLVAVAPDGTFAAFCYCFIDPDENARRGEQTGRIWLLGTRRGHREIGLGRAMLLTGLRLLRREGMAVARLGVDAINPTGAVRLYESAGFRPAYSRIFYRKGDGPAEGETLG